MADTPSQNFGPLPDTLTFGPFGPDGDIIVHIENLVLGCPPYVENIGVPAVLLTCGAVNIGSASMLSGGTLMLAATSGYFSVRSPSDDLGISNSGVPIYTVEGSYCFGPTDENGYIGGSVTEVDLVGATGMDLSLMDLSSARLYLSDHQESLVDLSSNPELSSLDLSNCPVVTGLDLSENRLPEGIFVANASSLASVIPPTDLFACGRIQFFQCALNEASIDAVFNAADPTLVADEKVVDIWGVAPTTASQSNRIALAAAGWYLYLNGSPI